MAQTRADFEAERKQRLLEEVHARAKTSLVFLLGLRRNGIDDPQALVDDGVPEDILIQICSPEPLMQALQEYIEQALVIISDHTGSRWTSEMLLASLGKE